jgi:hypothetical protein
MATKTPVRKSRVTKAAVSKIRENAKRDNSPRWEGSESWTDEQFTKHFHSAMDYYRLEANEKDPKSKVINWMGQNGYERDVIQSFKKTKDWRTSLTMCNIASCLMRGMPDSHPSFNKGRSTVEWLKKSIDQVIREGANDVEVTVTQKIVEPERLVSVYDRVREQAATMSDELEYAIDGWITDPETFDPKAIKVTSLLRGQGAKAAHARQVWSLFEHYLSELQELASGNADEQLKEAYGNRPRKHIRKLMDFLEGIRMASEQIAAESKVLKKPRAKKVKPVEEQVKNVKFKISDDKLGVSSVPAAGIIGAQGVVVYNTKTRKLGMYISKSSEGLGVKGTSITGFNDLSVQRTLRKPDQQIKEFRALSTQKRFTDWFTKTVKTTETVLTGRINSDIMILKVFK